MSDHVLPRSESDDTDRMRFSLGDRAAVNNEFKILRAEIAAKDLERDKRAAEFYATRMVPHERGMDRLRFLVGVVFGIAGSALLVAIVVLVMVLAKL